MCGCGEPDLDSDGDGLCDCCDPCPMIPNDPVGDPCDNDEDDDGFDDWIDECPWVPGTSDPPIGCPL
jgi:syndecan 4